MVKISYVEITARSDYPTVGRKDLHIWEPTLQTLAKQTMKDFEVIVVDIFYHERPNYFKEHNYGLKIKHIPSAPNIWFDLKLPQPCHQINKGFIHADGELLFVNGDSFMYPPDFMANLWKHYQEGYFVASGFASELTYFEPRKIRNKIEVKVSSVFPTEWYRFLGFDGRVHVHDRYMKYLVEANRDMAIIHPGEYYGASTLSLEAALKVNGFDQAFDGDSVLADCDMGKRLATAGYNKVAMFKDCYCVEAMAELGWHPKMRHGRQGGIKCNYALMMFNELTCRYRANDPLSEADIQWIINKICLGGRCGQIRVCKEINRFFPFFLKEETELVEYWKKYQAPMSVDLELEREMRIDGEEPYLEGTFVNVQ